MDPFSALAAISAAIQAIYAGLQFRHEISAQEALAAAAKAQSEAAPPNPDERSYWDTLDVSDAYERKIEQAYEKFKTDLSSASSGGSLQRVADNFNAEICDLLRSLKAVSGGRLPSDRWYDIWAKHRC